MPICEICQADGVITVGSGWYCIDHLYEALYAFAEQVKLLRHEEDDAVDVLHRMVHDLYNDEDDEDEVPVYLEEEPQP